MCAIQRGVKYRWEWDLAGCQKKIGVEDMSQKGGSEILRDVKYRWEWDLDVKIRWEWMSKKGRSDWNKLMVVSNDRLVQHHLVMDVLKLLWLNMRKQRNLCRLQCPRQTTNCNNIQILH